MKLLHHTQEPFVFDPTRQYREGEHFKPHGLWVSVEGDHDWWDWCTSEGFHIEGLTYASRVTLRPDANVLVIDTLDKLEAFDKEFAYAPDCLVGTHDRLRMHVRWPADRYDGLIIAPYQWEVRYEMMWYYPWDCASGVIWNLRAIKRVGPSVKQKAPNEA